MITLRASFMGIDSRERKTLLILMMSVWALPGLREMASEAASMFEEKRTGQGPAAASPLKRWALTGQEPSLMAGTLSLRRIYMI